MLVLPGCLRALAHHAAHCPPPLQPHPDSGASQVAPGGRAYDRVEKPMYFSSHLRLDQFDLHTHSLPSEPPLLCHSRFFMPLLPKPPSLEAFSQGRLLQDQMKTHPGSLFCWFSGTCWLPRSPWPCWRRRQERCPWRAWWRRTRWSPWRKSKWVRNPLSPGCDLEMEVDSLWLCVPGKS